MEFFYTSELVRVTKIEIENTF